jgi:hypothetical protein
VPNGRFLYDAEGHLQEVARFFGVSLSYVKIFISEKRGLEKRGRDLLAVPAEAFRQEQSLPVLRTARLNPRKPAVAK